MGMVGPVSGDHAVAVERSVGSVMVVEISSESEDVVRTSGIHRPADGLVDEVPYISSLVCRILAHGVPVLLEVSDGIAHGMGVFALDEGTVGIGGGVPYTAFHSEIHRAVDVGIAVTSRPFVLYRTGRIIRLDPVVQLIEVLTVSGFIAHTPDNYARMVEIPFHHPLSPLEMSVREVGPLRQGSVTVTHSVGFDVRFVGHIYSVLVAQVVPNGIVGIMAGPDGIDVEFLHYADIPYHVFPRKDIATVGIYLMTVDSFYEDRLSVDEELGSLHFHCPESHPY